MSNKKNECNTKQCKVTEDDNCIDKNIFDIFYEEFIENGGTSEDSCEKNNKECTGEEKLKISTNCNLKVDFDTKNKVIYLQPGKTEFFTVSASRCCGAVNIIYNGSYSKDGICGNLARYKIVQSGIIAEVYPKLDPRKNDYLSFRAIDECTKEYYDFVVVFSSNLYNFC